MQTERTTFLFQSFSLNMNCHLKKMNYTTINCAADMNDNSIVLLLENMCANTF